MKRVPVTEETWSFLMRNSGFRKSVIIRVNPWLSPLLLSCTCHELLENPEINVAELSDVKAAFAARVFTEFPEKLFVPRRAG